MRLFLALALALARGFAPARGRGSPTSSSSSPTTCAGTASASPATRTSRRRTSTGSAKEGVYFKNAFCTTSLCSPSRASILSGLYAHTPRRREQLHRVPDRPAELPAAAAGGRLRDGVHRQVAHGRGQRRQAARASTTSSPTRARASTSTPSSTSTARTARSCKGYYTHVVTDLAARLAEAATRRQAVPADARPQGAAQLLRPEPKYEHAFDDVTVAVPARRRSCSTTSRTGSRQRLDTWHGIYGPLFDFRKKFPDARPEAVKDFAAMTRAYWGTILLGRRQRRPAVRRSEGRRAARQHALRLHGRQRPAQRRARHGRQADDARAEHPRAAGRPLPAA